MPSAVTLPTFSDEEILTYETLNAMSQAINARFLAGIGASDLSWPLTAEGNLDMSVYNIVGGQQIWGFVNAGNFDTFAEALTAAGANGVVLVPPETTIGAAAAGHALSNAVTIVGAGVSSVLQMDASAAADMLQVSGGTGGGLYNLMLDGNSKGTARSGLSVNSATDYVISNVWTKNFTGAGLKFGAGLVSINVDGFNDTGSADGINAVGGANVNLNNIRLKNYTDKGFDFNGGGNALRVHATNIFMETTGGTGISFLGNGDVTAESGSEFYGENIHIKGAVGAVDGMVLGTSGAALDRVMLSNVTVEDATAAGITVNTIRGAITGCSIDNPTTAGIDLDTSTNVNVTGNHISNAANGIDLSNAGCDNCVVTDNSFETLSGVNVLRGDNTSVERGNGQLSSSTEMGMFNLTNETVTVTTGASDVMSMTIPANTLRAGDMLYVSCSVALTGNATAHTLALRLKEQNFASADTVGSGAGNDDMRLTGILAIGTATTGESQWQFSREVAGTNPIVVPGASAVTGLDVTLAQDVAVRVTPGGATGTDGLVVRSLFVKIVRGREYS